MTYDPIDEDADGAYDTNELTVDTLNGLDLSANVGSPLQVDGDTVFAALDIPDSVIHRWQFNGGSGSTANDSVGANDGAISGATYTTTSAEGDSALQFDGTDDYVDISNIDLLAGGFAISVWIKTTSSGNSINDAPAVIAENDSSENPEYRLIIQDGNIEFLSQGNQFSHTASLNDGTFHHVVVTRNSGTLEFYIDNSSVFTTTYTNTTTNNQTTRIGANGAFNSSNNFDGTMDDLAIADDGFSADDVDSMYQIGT
jgi:hypothetical protein